LPRLARQYRDLSVPVTEFTFTVNLPEDGTRLDVLLRAHFAWRSRQHFQGMIDRGDVLVNDGVRKASLRLRKGDVVRVRIPVAADAPAKETDDGLVVLYEDDALVAIDKAAGVVAHPTGRIRHGTLINRLHARYRRPGEGRADVVPRLAHRLDKDTSGVVLVVKDRRLDAEVTRSFFRREVRKTYVALRPRSPAGARGGRRAARPRDRRRHQARDVRARGRSGVAHLLACASAWAVDVARGGASHGRTHQIRVHPAPRPPHRGRPSTATSGPSAAATPTLPSPTRRTPCSSTGSLSTPTASSSPIR
jgi:23S rRNA pseudouridine1911/1915/1917 synthase